MTTTLTRASFDAPDRLNEDGSVTLRIIPSNWHRYHISPDTYQRWNGDYFVDSEIEHWSEQEGRDLTYDDFKWTYNHQGIVRGLAETLAVWIEETLKEAGLDTARDFNVIDTWSPREYNFVSDGFEVEFTCDPAQLRELTPDFDVDDWGHEYYRSYDGFISYVTGRLHEDSWHADYDGEFRVESLLAAHDPHLERGWMQALDEDEYEVYMDNVTCEVIHPEHMDSGFTLPELEAWAAEIAPPMTQPETLFDTEEDA